MSALLLDADVVSFLLKGDTRAELYRRHIEGKLAVVSFMTVAELYRWALVRRWGEARRGQLEQHLRNFLVYPFNRNLCRRWAEVSYNASQGGRAFPCADAWIAATALEHSLPLATHNAAHYTDVPGLTVISESTS